MSYRWSIDESAEVNMHRIACEQIDLALGAVGGDLSLPEQVHEARKTCKRLRALLRLVRPALGKTYADENRAIRDAARRLSDVRDTQSAIDAYDALLDHFADEVDRRRYAPIRRRLTLTQASAERDDLAERLAAFKGDLEAVRDRVADWRLKADGVGAWADGVGKTYRRACKRMAEAAGSSDPELFHEWRKRAKYHRHHTELLEPMSPGEMKGHAREAERLTDVLGEAQNLSVLARAIAADEAQASTDRAAAIESLIDRWRDTLQRQALAQGERVFAEKPGELIDRWKRYWHAWQAERTMPAA